MHEVLHGEHKEDSKLKLELKTKTEEEAKA
jgi:hypothetical protein